MIKNILCKAKKFTWRLWFPPLSWSSLAALLAAGTALARITPQVQQHQAVHCYLEQLKHDGNSKTPTQSQRDLGRHQHSGRASNLKQTGALSSVEEQQADARQRQAQVLGYSYSSKKGHLEKQQGLSILTVWVENSTNCLKHFCDMQQPDPALMSQLFPPQQKSFKNSIMTAMEMKEFAKSSYWVFFRAT